MEYIEVRVSLCYLKLNGFLLTGVTSKYTSFVAIDAKDEKPSMEHWAMETRHVPSQFAHGWHGGNQHGKMYRAPVQECHFRAMIKMRKKRCADRECDATDVSTPVERLIGLQSFDGSYLLDDKLSEIVGVSLAKLKKGTTFLPLLDLIN